MKKTLTTTLLAIFMCVCMVLGFAGCSVETTDASAIASINEQITAINKSIDDLKATDTALDGYINALKARVEVLENGSSDGTNDSNNAAEIATLKTAIASLESKDTELANKITTLEATVETLATKDWANATFATLESYQSVQTSISAINTEIAGLKDSVASKTELTKAISDSETSMKKWVNEEFAKGYYTTAQIDAMIAQLRLEAYDDSEIRKDLADQKSALEKAQADIKTAYEKAIKDAISTNNGEIDTKIANAIKEANDKLESRIAVIENKLVSIENDIKQLKSDLSALTGRVNTIDEQITAINNSITNLEKVDTELKGYIETLQSKVKTLEENSGTKAEIQALQNLITSLQEKDTALENKITALKKYVDDELASNKDWANATFATLEALASTNNEIASIKETIKGLATSENLSTAISTLETSLKTWVSGEFTEFAKGYYTIAEIDAEINALETSDSNMKADIEAQKTALENAKTELTEAYKKAISDAITNYDGEISTKITNIIEDVQGNLEAGLDSIRYRVEFLEGKVEKNEKNISNLLARIEQLEKDKEALQNQINCMNGNHVANDDDDDCTTAVLCKYCDHVMTEAKGAHDFTGAYQKTESGHYHICQNEGCTVQDEHVEHSFGGYADNDDGTHTAICEQCGYRNENSTTAHSLTYTTIFESYCSSEHNTACENCDYSITEEHEFVYEDSGDGTHTPICKYCKYETYEMLSHTAENCKCKYCHAIVHNGVSSDTGICTGCGEFVAAASITANGTKTYYATLDDAVTYANSNANTVIVIENNCVGLSELINSTGTNTTIDLNGKTVRNSRNYIIYINGGSLMICDSVGGGKTTGGILGGRAGTLTITGGTHSEVNCPDSLIITGGKFEYVGTNVADKKISGGSFEKFGVWNGAGTLDSVLEDGYCFYDADGNKVDTSNVEATDYWYYLYNVTVGKVSE